MNTGSFENFAGEIAQIGPMYPFVGWEFLLFILVVVYWVLWHIRQLRLENKEYQEDLSEIVKQKLLSKIKNK